MKNTTEILATLLVLTLKSLTACLFCASLQLPPIFSVEGGKQDRKKW